MKHRKVKVFRDALNLTHLVPNCAVGEIKIGCSLRWRKELPYLPVKA